MGKINFLVSGNVTQTITSLKGESDEEIVKKLKAGKYSTTLHDGFIVETDTFENVATIDDNDNECEYFDFETSA